MDDLISMKAAAAILNVSRQRVPHPGRQIRRPASSTLLEIGNPWKNPVAAFAMPKRDDFMVLIDVASEP